MQSPQFISTLCHVKTIIMIVCISSSDVIINGSTLCSGHINHKLIFKRTWSQTLTAYDRDIMAPVLSVSPGATWSHNIKQCSLEFPFVSFSLFSFPFFALFCTVSSGLLWNDFKSSFALLCLQSNQKTSWSMRWCRGFSWNYAPLLGHKNISR